MEVDRHFEVEFAFRALDVASRFEQNVDYEKLAHKIRAEAQNVSQLTKMIQNDQHVYNTLLRAVSLVYRYSPSADDSIEANEFELYLEEVMI